MAENKPINWAYPFPSKETNSNPLQLLTHMAKAKGGYYPTGENGLWHGGVHFDDGTAAVFDQSSVRCIADGEVIAYRIDERYPVSEFIDEVPRIKRASFSTGFVLAKHSLCPPPLDNAAGASSSEQSPPALTFYSLYTFNARGMLSADEQHNYRAQISKADGGPIVALARLYDIVDTDEDGVLTSKEIQAALAKPWHAQVLGQLITRYESEWFWNKAKWDELDLLLADENGQKSPAWEVEKQRIETLSWWKELAGKHGISGDGKAWYLQPLALTGVFSSATKVDPTIKEGQITFDAEGNNIPTSPFFSRVIHWPGNDLSGVTLGRGYDMGSRSESEIYNHMRNAGIEHDQATKIAQGYGKKGTTAQQFVRDNKTNIGEISTEQEIILFNTIYPDYVERAVKNYNHWTASEPDRTEWSALDQVIRDVLVDFVYQGFTKGPNPMKAGMRNDKEELIRYIENTPAISQYELGRNRARYLRSN